MTDKDKKIDKRRIPLKLREPEPPPPPGVPGRPRRLFNKKEALKIKWMVLADIPIARICRILSMSEQKMYELYSDTLENAHEEARTKVVRSLYKRAIAGDIKAQIFWLKARAGWTDRPSEEQVQRQIMDVLKSLGSRALTMGEDEFSRDEYEEIKKSKRED